MNQAKVSIITRTRDRELFLARAMASVLGQVDPPAWEWIVVNDAGDPATVEAVLREAREQFPEQLQVLHLPESRGMEHASNRGIEQATGEFLIIHDDDDSWEPDFLRRMTAWLEAPAHRQYAGVVCHSLLVEEVIEGDRIVINKQMPFNPWLQEVDPWMVLEENPYPPISFLFRRLAYDEAGPFDEELPVLGDWEFNVRLILRHPLGLLPEMLARYHHRPRGSTGSTANSITAGHDTHRHWENVLRDRWRQAPPLEGLPCFGQLAAAAGNIRKIRVRLDQLLSLPIRPGP
ncbi:MAG: glycosyltransferase family 2 protein [Puniceicoccaceae bacterium]